MFYVENGTDELVECALAKGGEDNVTVQVAQFNLPWRRRLGALAWPALALVLVGLGTVLVFMLYRPQSGTQASASAASAAPAAAGASAATSVPVPAPAAQHWELQHRRGL